MASRTDSSLSSFMSSVKIVFAFFFFMGRKAKKTKIFYILSFLPVLMALIFVVTRLISGSTGIEGMYVFSNMIMACYLQFFILILALFYGTSVCSEETEGRTLTYLITRPIPKSAVILGKYAAYTLLIILMTVFGVIVSFIILNMNNLFDLAAFKILLKDTGVLILGLISYTALFTLLGTFLRRSILVGLVFSFGWENVIQYFPGSTQKVTIAHYIKSLLPSSSGGRFSFLLFRLEPTAPAVAVIILLLITGISLALACLVFSWKEYIYED
jgi:ABC-type transport system involved in multi-copper enzyme maturation permease subunit